MKINRRFYVRAIAIVLVILFAILMALIGKQHSILIDNKNIEVNGSEIKVLQLVEVQIDKEPSMELARRDRVQVDIQGQSFRLKVIYSDKNWEEQVLEKKLKVPFSEDMILLSIPAFIENMDDIDSYLEPFVIITE